MSEVLPYLGIPTDDASVETTTTASSTIAVKDVTDKTVAEAKKILKESGFKVSVAENIDEATAIVAEQVPKSGIYLDEGSTIALYTTAEQKSKILVPNIKGKTLDEATKILQSKGLNIKAEGEKGIIVSQEPSYDIEVNEGTVINVVVKEELIDGQ